MKKMCAKCGGATKTKMAKGGSMKTTVGSKSAKSFIAGIPNGGPTGPNYQGVDTMKKGGATKKKYQDGGYTNTTPGEMLDYSKMNRGSKMGDKLRAAGSKIRGAVNKKSRVGSGPIPAPVDRMNTNTTPGQVFMPPMKKGGTTKKYAKGGSSFGMLSVKAGVDKNPKATAADRIAGAKMNKKKMGGTIRKKK
jgi:hypothetical protein